MKLGREFESWTAQKIVLRLVEDKIVLNFSNIGDLGMDYVIVKLLGGFILSLG